MAETSPTLQAPNGLWQRQFDPANDYPPVPITRKVAMCTTPRCGSHFLGHKLHALGLFGYPLEYFNSGNWRVWQDRAGAVDPLNYIKSVRTGPNGVFSVKLHHEHLADFLRYEPEPLNYKFIHLCRRDLTKQAISFARAQQTGAWISDMPEIRPAVYDRAMIAKKMDAIAKGNAGWQSFLGSIGIRPLQLFYEDVLADTDAAIARVADYLDVDIGEVTAQEPAFAPQRQKKQTQDDWLTRFEQDCRTALADGHPLPGVSYPAATTLLRRRTLKAARKLRAKTGL